MRRAKRARLKRPRNLPDRGKHRSGSDEPTISSCGTADNPTCENEERGRVNHAARHERDAEAGSGKSDGLAGWTSSPVVLHVISSSTRDLAGWTSVHVITVQKSRRYAIPAVAVSWAPAPTDSHGLILTCYKKKGPTTTTSKRYVYSISCPVRLTTEPCPPFPVSFSLPAAAAVAATTRAGRS